MRNLNNKRNNIGVNDVMIDKKLWNGFILSEVLLYCIYLKLIPRFSYGVDHKIKHFAYERFVLDKNLTYKTHFDPFVICQKL